MFIILNDSQFSPYCSLHLTKSRRILSRDCRLLCHIYRSDLNWNAFSDNCVNETNCQFRFCQEKNYLIVLRLHSREIVTFGKEFYSWHSLCISPTHNSIVLIKFLIIRRADSTFKFKREKEIHWYPKQVFAFARRSFIIGNNSLHSLLCFSRHFN